MRFHPDCGSLDKSHQAKKLGYKKQRKSFKIMRNFLIPLPNLNGASILVTGGTGSLGKAFISRVLDKFNPKKLIVFSRDELKQSEMMERFPDSKYPSMRYFLGDIRDVDRLKLAMREVGYVVHAAALKQVPAAEYNPMECIKTNVLGAENIVMAAMDAGVSRVVALSTDKASNPINLYGASKLASDKIFIAANNLSGVGGTRFSVVRYGNVVGSRGSLIPIVKRLVEDGAPFIPVTDERMTRFWITLEQGVDVVLSSLEMMNGGEIFVPKIPSMKITDLVNILAPEVPYKVTGIRPGEKIHEVMITGDDARQTFELEDRFIIQPAFDFWKDKQSSTIQGTQVKEGFVYSSDTNPDWLTPEGLHEMCGN